MPSHVRIILTVICLTSCTVTLSQPRKNVILIIVDDLNQSVFKDENLFDCVNLFNSGLSVYTNAFASAPSCGPSRTGMLTGIHPMRSGLVLNKSYPLKVALPYAVSIPEYLRDQAYTVAAYGKIFHGADNRKDYWDQFESLYSRPPTSNVPNHGLEELYENGARQFDWGFVDQPQTAWGDNKIVRRGIDFIKRQETSDTPFFLALGMRLPHLPWYLPQGYEEIAVREVFVPDCVDVDEVSGSEKLGDTISYAILRENGRLNEAAYFYSRGVKFSNDQLALFLREFTTSSLVDNTMVVIVGDNGFHLGSKKRFRKKTLWMESLRVPLFIYQPGSAARDTIRHPVSLQDIYPTIVDYVQKDGNPFLDGQSLLNNEEPPREVFAVSENNDLSVITNESHSTYYHDGSSQFYNGITTTECENEAQNFDATLQAVDYKVLYEEYLLDLRLKVEITDELTLHWDSIPNQYYSLRVLKDGIPSIQDSIVFRNQYIVDEQLPFTVRLECRNPQKRSWFQYFDVDVHGNTSLKRIVDSDMKCIYMESITPNPTNSQSTVELFSCKSIAVDIYVRDLLGSTSIRHTIELNEGRNEVDLDFSGLMKGTYLLSVDQETLKFIVL